ncbi:hypothetical protein [Micromonospora endolithica]|uniref:Uncharacterized protein n=1 Tax=Micromonospora endolithica TaxID=230091 RepID=A0A3A9YS53_9ACTN|nr:hypothetical protein [Micromonospora endolithica]RKN38891.1 hypothetical protein D7223_30110 [Micromonospora endolithica]
MAVIAVGLLGGFVAGLLNLFDTDSSLFEGDPPGWARIVGLVLLAVGLVVVFGGFVWLLRSGRYKRNAQSPLWALSWSRRWSLGRQVKGKAPVRDEDRPLLREVAEQMAGQRAHFVPFAGLIVTQFGQAFLQWAPFWSVMAAVLGIVGVLGLVATRRDERLAREFLRRHPA